MVRGSNLKLVMQNPTSLVPLTRAEGVAHHGHDLPGLVDELFRPFSHRTRRPGHPRDHPFRTRLWVSNFSWMDGWMVVITLGTYYVAPTQVLKPGPRRKNGRTQLHVLHSNTRLCIPRSSRSTGSLDSAVYIWPWQYCELRGSTVLRAATSSGPAGQLSHPLQVFDLTPTPLSDALLDVIPRVVGVEQ